MAGAATIGALRVVIGADTAALDKGLKDAQSSLAGFGNSMKIAGAVIAGAFAGALGGITAGLIKTVKQADEMGNVAAKVGMTTEALSALKYAAEFSDVSFETLTSSMGKLNKAMAAAAGNAGSKAAKVFQQMGVEVRDLTTGALRPNAEVLKDIATKFAGYEDGAAKSALATYLFGRAGADMIPLLNEGGAGIQRLMDRAKELGIVISGETSDAADKFGKTMFDLGAIKSAMFLKLTEQLLPTLQNLANVFVSAANDSNLMKAAGQGLMIVFNTLATAVLGVGAAITAFSAIVSNVISAAQNIAKGELSAAWDDLKKGAGDAVEAYKKAGNSIVNIWTGTGSTVVDAAKKTGDAIKKTQAPVINFSNEAEKAAKKQAAAIEQISHASDKMIADLNAEYATLGLSIGQQAAYKFELEQVAIAQKKGVDQNPAVIASIQAQSQAIGDLTNKVSDARNAWDFANHTVDSGASAFADWAMGTKSAADAFKDFAMSVIRDVLQMIAKFIILRTVVQPLLGGVLGGGGAAGLLGLPGLGFAEGGSFIVPGGVSMTDNVSLGGIGLASGERVTVDSNHSGSSSGNIIQIVMGNKRTRWATEEVRDLIGHINAAIGDGTRLRLA